MSSRRRSPDRRRDGLHSSSSRAAAASSRLRMDRNPTHSRITDPAEPAGRRREIDNVMKKARGASPNANGYWDKKLLEVEEKDPNRWRHTGYKQMYLEKSSSTSPSRRNGASVRRSRTRSRSRTRRTPPTVSSRPRPKSPPPRARSISASSLSSCSDDSCSVCSPKHRGSKPIRSRSRSFSVPRRAAHKVNTTAGIRADSRANRPQQPRQKLRGPASPPPQSPPPPRSRPVKVAKPVMRRPPPPAQPEHRRPEPREQREHRQPMVEPSPDRHRISRAQMPLPMVETTVPSSSRVEKKRPKEMKRPKMLETRIKKEKKSKGSKRQSPSAAAESSGSEDSSSCSEATPIVAATRLTLSERFGKMAQWSVDRRDIENMRITKNSSGGDLKVMIEEDDVLYGSPPPRYSHSPAPQGHYPDELLQVGPTGLASWDDVRVRYQYYKERGYLRDLTLDDYIKWEEWWYKYQEWLKAERYYEHWVSQQQNNRHNRRKRLPASQRLN